MKSISLFSAGLLAMGALLLAAPASQATVSSAAGDLVLGFRTDDNSQPYTLEIDLGQASVFLGLSPGTTINLNQGAANFFGTNGGLAPADLATVFGANWNTNTGLLFSVAGASSTNNDLYATFAPGTIPNRQPTQAQANAKSIINKVQNGLGGSPSTFDNGSTEVALSSPQAAGFPQADLGGYAYIVVNGNGTSNGKDYNYLASTEGAVSSSGSSNLDFYRLAPGNGAGQKVGTFSLGSDGSFSFTAAPEPGSVALLGLSAMTLLFRRRRTVQA